MITLRMSPEGCCPGGDQHAAVLAAVKNKPCGWPQEAAILDSHCAPRRGVCKAGAERWLQPNKEMPVQDAKRSEQPTHSEFERGQLHMLNIGNSTYGSQSCQFNQFLNIAIITVHS
jgi:hypothetical protein